MSYVKRIACLSGKYRLNEARAAYENLDRMAPGITIAACVQAVPFAFENDAEGLRRAGMPEG